MMNAFVLRGIAAASVLSLSACGALDIFGSNEVPLSGTRIPVRVAETSSAVRVDAPEMQIVLPAATANASWPQLNGNASRSLGHVAASASLRQVWTASIGSGNGSSTRIVSPPIVAGGRVYALDAAASVAALDASSGGRVWSADLTPEGENSIDGFGGGLAHEGDRVYATTGFGQLYALSAATGEIIWTAPLGAPSRAAPAVAGGRVFAVTRDNRIIAVDAASGRILWTEQGLEQVAGILGGAAPAATDRVVIAPFSSGELNAYAVESGRVGWVDDLTGTRGSTGLAALNDVSGDPVIVGDVVYAASQSGRLVAVELRSGERLWTRDIGGLQPPYVAGNTLFFVSGQGALVAVNATTGDVAWSTELGAYRDPDDREDAITWAGPVVAGGRLLLVSDLGKLVSVDPASGSVIGEVDLPGGASNGPVVAGGTVYVLTDGGSIAAYR